MFFGVALVSGALALLAEHLGLAGETPAWAFVVFVIGIDVAHVWSTVFRVYLDGAEVRRRPRLYAAAPLVALGLGVAAHAVSSDFFWRALAYVAVWHFIRQQTGWVVLYGRRAGDSERVINFDVAAMWATTLGPVLWWHANLPRSFWWFKENDFVAGVPAWVGTTALVLDGLMLFAWLAVSALQRRLHVGKVLLLAATSVAWFGGIVLATNDFAFTVMNVTLHGVPYLVLTRRYEVGRLTEAGAYGAFARVLRVGLPVFLGSLVAVAFAEEYLWDRLVWHEQAGLFGHSSGELGAWSVLVVPLLALPQMTHYLLDGFIWRGQANPLLGQRLGWSKRAVAPLADELTAVGDESGR